MQLDGWEENDTPVFEHETHSPNCGWAINKSINWRNRINDPNRVEEDPLCDKMLQARIATFDNRWPHEGKKGWKCKVQRVRFLHRHLHMTIFLVL
jgi:hypothetical protein